MKKYYRFEMNMTIANILCILIFLVFTFLISIFIDFKFNDVSYTIMILYFLFHELCHGLGYALFTKDKSKIKFGAKLESGVFYAMDQSAIFKKGILISLIMPLIILTFITGIIGLIFNIPSLVFYSILNLSGAIGDIIMFIFTIKLPNDIEYIDYDMTIGAYYLSNEDLSKYSNVFMKCTESGKNKKIDDSIKKVTISKPSYIIMALLIVLDVLRMFL